MMTFISYAPTITPNTSYCISKNLFHNVNLHSEWTFQKYNGKGTIQYWDAGYNSLKWYICIIYFKLLDVYIVA